jgi:hypothetical protein
MSLSNAVCRIQASLNTAAGYRIADTKELNSRELESRELRAFGSQEADQWTKREGTK